MTPEPALSIEARVAALEKSKSRLETGFGLLIVVVLLLSARLTARIDAKGAAIEGPRRFKSIEVDSLTIRGSRGDALVSLEKVDDRNAYGGALTMRGADGAFASLLVVNGAVAWQLANPQGQVNLGTASDQTSMEVTRGSSMIEIAAAADEAKIVARHGDEKKGTPVAMMLARGQETSISAEGRRGHLASLLATEKSAIVAASWKESFLANSCSDVGALSMARDAQGTNRAVFGVGEKEGTGDVAAITLFNAAGVPVWNQEEAANRGRSKR